MMTPERRKEFRLNLAKVVLPIQDAERATGTPIDIFLPEFIAALLSLAAHISAHNAGLSRKDFLKTCEATANEQWI